MERELYPLYIKLCGDIEKGHIMNTAHSGEILESFGAITIAISVDSENYPKEKVYEAVKEIVLKAIEYFH